MQQPSRRQLRSITRAAAAIDAAYGDRPRSISRLHDDELVSVLAFLHLKDLAQLVRCSRRFNGVARRERGRELAATPAMRSIPALVRSSLSHHITSVRLEKRDASDSNITRATLQQLRSLPQLTKLDVRVYTEGAAASLLHGASSASAAESLQTVLPSSVRALSLTAFPQSRRAPEDKFKAVIATFLGAVVAMPQLMELTLRQTAQWNGMRLDALAALPQLRKLSLLSSSTGLSLVPLKAMNQLRELTLGFVESEELLSLFTLPHSLQLEVLRMETELFGDEMRALLSVPTLTELQPFGMDADAWSLLPQLPHLRRLVILPETSLTAEHTSSLSTALSRCTALEDVTLSASFEPDENEQEEEELLDENGAVFQTVMEARWTDILRSVPNLRRMTVATGNDELRALFTVLPAHLPRLEQLMLDGWSGSVVSILTQLAHPTLKQLELTEKLHRALSQEQLQSMLHNPRLPYLCRCAVTGGLHALLHVFDFSGAW
jgi:hypothetical protein